MSNTKLTLEEVDYVVESYNILCNTLHKLIDNDYENLGIQQGEGYTIEFICPESDEIELGVYGSFSGDYYEYYKSIKLSNLLKGEVSNGEDK